MSLDVRLRIFHFLSEIDGKLSIRFLEHVVFEMSDENITIHTQLLTLYFDEYKLHESEARTNCTICDQSSRDKINHFLNASQFYDATMALSCVPRGEQYLASINQRT